MDVDVGILSNGRRQHASHANLHAMNKGTGRSLKSEEELPYMCPDKHSMVGGDTTLIYLTRRMAIFPIVAVQAQLHVVQIFVNAWNRMPMVKSCSAWIHSSSFVKAPKWRSAWVTSFVQYVIAPCSHALSMVVHFMSAHVSIGIVVARNTEMLGIAQGLNAVKLKLMMRGGRLA